MEEQFLEEYTGSSFWRNILRGGVQCQPKQVQFQHESSPTCSREGGFFHWLGEHGSDVHIGAGCDSCGVNF
ncbi:hypothetical protein RHGRI_017461 [Rhododendron griersonianum]|uniref:Uncharacterized protein n=1 Tax=Rhododendron griersonianum TaxID=479676 RepID=A0AAV6JXV4_9ERIC|nr:hypothetical protein RHGRI_017461 [Rhododendron griersonianum]